MEKDDNAPPHPVTRRPTWRMRTIVSSAVAVVVVAVGYSIINASSRIDPLGKAAGAEPTGEAALVRLRSQMPAHLRSAKECVPTAPAPNAVATISCIWAKTHVPSSAIYSLFADNTTMVSAAESIRGGGGRGGPGRGGGLGTEVTSCDTAEDFDKGGKTTWQSDNRERGTVWCYLNSDGEPELLFTDTATLIVTSAVAPAAQQAEQLLGWFREEGQPEPSPEPSPSRGSPSPSPSPSSSPEPTDSPTNGPTEPTDGPTTDGPETDEPGPGPT